MGKIAVVTAGGSNLGGPIALALSQAGWDLAISYLDSPAECQAIVDEIEATGRKVIALKADVGIKADVDGFFAAIKDHYGAWPTLLVNNAGVQTWSSLLDLKEEDWDKVIRTNLKGCFLNTQAFARGLVEAGLAGNIVNMGSGCNQNPFPRLVDYTASKGGIEMFTKVSAVELGPYGVRVNCVAPGAVITERTKIEAPNYVEEWSAITPLRKVCTPGDIADMVLFLASEQSRLVSGQTLLVDGGVFTQANWPYKH